MWGEIKLKQRDKRKLKLTNKGKRMKHKKTNRTIKNEENQVSMERETA